MWCLIGANHHNGTSHKVWSVSISSIGYSMTKTVAGESHFWDINSLAVFYRVQKDVGEPTRNVSGYWIKCSSAV